MYISRNGLCLSFQYRRSIHIVMRILTLFSLSLSCVCLSGSFLWCDRDPSWKEGRRVLVEMELTTDRDHKTISQSCVLTHQSRNMSIVNRIFALTGCIVLVAKVDWDGLVIWLSVLLWRSCRRSVTRLCSLQNYLRTVKSITCRQWRTDLSLSRTRSHVNIWTMSAFFSFTVTKRCERSISSY